MQDNAKLHIVMVQGWVKKDGKFLMAQRSFKELQAPGAWSIPGGKIEEGEGLGVVEQTLKKEILEEVGVSIKDNVKYISSDAFTRVDGKHVVSLCFLCEWKEGEAKALQETETVKWFSLQELRDFKEAKPFLKNLISALETFLLKDSS